MPSFFFDAFDELNFWEATMVPVRLTDFFEDEVGRAFADGFAAASQEWEILIDWEENSVLREIFFTLAVIIMCR